MAQISEYSSMDNLLEGCQIIGFDWRYIYINYAAANHGRRSREEFNGKKFINIWPDIESTKIFRIIKKCLEERIPNYFENKFDFPDGTTGWFKLNIQPIPEGALILSIDVTELKMANLRLEEKNKELAFQNEEKEKRAVELIIANEVTLQRLQIIQGLNKIDKAISGNLDLNLTLNIVLELVKAQLKVDAAAILLLNPHTQIYEFAAGIGFRGKEIEETQLNLGEEFAGSGVLEKKAMCITGLLENNAQLFRAQFLAGEGFEAYFGSPLIAKDKVKGILEVFHRSTFTPDENWLEFLNVLAEQTAVAVDNANLYIDLKSSNIQLFAAYEHTIEGWSHALDLRDKETEGHTQRVTEMTLKLASAAGLSKEELVHIRRGALLHDIGKLGVPDHILLKPDKLTGEEWDAMKKHPVFAYELLSPIEYLKPALCIPYCHHEKWDGSGYPRGLKGEQIPIEARLFSIVDVWDALLSDRPYRAGWPIERIIEHIKSMSGKDFDPKVVELFMRVIGEDAKEADLHIKR